MFEISEAVSRYGSRKIFGNLGSFFSSDMPFGIKGHNEVGP
jgi:hypothetical protein